jgi:hypothetical protein
LILFVFKTKNIRITTYYSKITTPFLALKDDAGDCSRVTVTNTATQLLDKNGRWESSANFDSTEALFVVKFSEYEATDSSYEKDMESLHEAIQSEMKLLKYMSDLPTKILHLTSWRITIDAVISGDITVWFNAYPSSIFDLTNQRFDSTIGQQSHNCNSEDGWSFSDGM